MEKLRRYWPLAVACVALLALGFCSLIGWLPTPNELANSSREDREYWMEFIGPIIPLLGVFIAYLDWRNGQQKLETSQHSLETGS
ncbi:hypothetical protein [Corynebacterium vitaeruminis]|uniref:hypothetical protein n=1 Tax=Corynebacterium vitaeruminis TaxID=38305 RepID=UPI0012DF2A88|nr:hypothetical protein [Corynebacterium vitaeruminis]